MPEALISRITSRGPGVGSGNSLSSSLRFPRNTTPSMVLLRCAMLGVLDRLCLMQPGSLARRSAASAQAAEHAQRATDKSDEFPSPHGFARAEDTVGREKNITLWIENCVVRYT